MRLAVFPLAVPYLLNPAGIVVLDRVYQSEAAAVVRERLLLAGSRLAALLEQALAMPGPTRRQ